MVSFSPLGGQRDFGGEAITSVPGMQAAYGFAQVRMGLHFDDDAVASKAELRVLGINRAGALRIALEVIPTVGAAEELLFQGV